MTNGCVTHRFAWRAHVLWLYHVLSPYCPFLVTCCLVNWAQFPNLVTCCLVDWAQFPNLATCCLVNWAQFPILVTCYLLIYYYKSRT